MHFQLALLSLLVSLLPSSWASPTCSCSGSCAVSTEQRNTSVSMGWWATYHAQNMSITSIPWSSYSIVSFFVSPINASGVVMDQLEQYGKDFTAAAHENNVTALLTVGGYTGSAYFSPLVGSPDNRTALANSIVSIAQEYGFDGIDFDWEYPNRVGAAGNIINANDTDNFLALLQSVKSQASNLILTAAASDAPWNDTSGNPSTNLTGFATVLDYVELMNYDNYGEGFSKTTGPNAPLVACGPNAAHDYSATRAVKEWTAAGFPASKIILGVPAYGHAFRVPPSTAIAANGSLSVYTAFDNTTLLQGDSWDSPAAPGGDVSFIGMANGTYLDTSGKPAQGAVYFYDNCTSTPYVYRNDTQAMISFDDAASFIAKGEFIKQSQLAGFAMFEVAGDYNGILIDAIKEGMKLPG